jgi:hypothetical protein
MASPDDPEIAMAQNPKPGVWLVASLCTSCDQTVASLFELARFYPGDAVGGEMASALLGTFPRSRARNGAAIDRFAALFEPPSHEALLSARPGCPYASRLVAAREASGASGYLGWMLHPAVEDESGRPRQWGALELFVMDYEFMPAPEIEGNEPDYASLEPIERVALVEAGLAHAEATLDALAAGMGFGPSSLVALGSAPISGQARPPRALGRRMERARWGEDWVPACLQGDLLAASEAEIERFAIGVCAAAAPLSGPRPPRV